MLTFKLLQTAMSLRRLLCNHTQPRRGRIMSLLNSIRHLNLIPPTHKRFTERISNLALNQATMIDLNGDLIGQAVEFQLTATLCMPRYRRLRQTQRHQITPRAINVFELTYKSDNHPREALIRWISSAIMIGIFPPCYEEQCM